MPSKTRETRRPQRAPRMPPKRPSEDQRETTRLNVRVPTPLYERFKDKVESEGRTMTWVVLQAIREYF